ncbi:MAG: NAD(P)H-hydrate dehydratase [Planctomycetota bacterium]
MRPAHLLTLPTREAEGHKGTFGTLAVVGGCDRDGLTMLGAPVLAGRAALRSGVGLCRLCVPRSLVHAALTALPPATGYGFNGPAPASLPSADATVFGPGLGPIASNSHNVINLVCDAARPAVIDADGLAALAVRVQDSNDAPDLSGCVLTPHPGEFARVAMACGVGERPTNATSRIAAAHALAERLNTTVVLKGAGTVVADGSDVWVCQRGHPCMATGGTGDVLAGVIGALLAQNASAGWEMSPFSLACIGVEAHAIAGERWARESKAEAGMLAQELADLIAATLWPSGE